MAHCVSHHLASIFWKCLPIFKDDLPDAYVPKNLGLVQHLLELYFFFSIQNTRSHGYNGKIWGRGNDWVLTRWHGALSACDSFTKYVISLFFSNNKKKTTKTHIKSRNEWCPSEVTGWASPYCRDIRDSMRWKGGDVLSIERCQAKIVMTGPQRGCWENRLMQWHFTVSQLPTSANALMSGSV